MSLCQAMFLGSVASRIEVPAALPKGAAHSGGQGWPVAIAEGDAKREIAGEEINIFERPRLFKGGRLETERDAKPQVSHHGLHGCPDNAKSAPGDILVQ